MQIGPAQSCGQIAPGDVVVAVNGEPVDELEHDDLLVRACVRVPFLPACLPPCLLAFRLACMVACLPT